MHPPLQQFIGNVLTRTSPRTIVSLGTSTRQYLKDMYAYCSEHATRLHIVDLMPDQANMQMAERYAPKIEPVVHRDLGLNVIPSLEQVDFVVMHEDYNWYTTFHTLLALENHLAKGSGDQFPIVCIDQIGWPYGRRDSYRQPDSIPLAYRQAHSDLGILPGSGIPLAEDGLHKGTVHSQYEGTPQNGVLTAIEDFLKNTTLDLTLMITLCDSCPIGILLPTKELSDNSALATYLESRSFSIATFETIEQLRQTYITQQYDTQKALDDKEAVLRKAQNEQEMLQAECAALQKREEEFSQEKIQFCKALEDAQTQNRILSQNLNELQIHQQEKRAEETQAMTQQIQEMQRQNNQRQQQIDQLEIERQTLQKDLQDSKQYSRQLATNLERTELAYRAAMQSRSEQFDILTQQLRTVHSEHIARRNQIRHMQQTLSWKFTKPIREFMRYLREPSAFFRDCVYLLLRILKAIWVYFDYPCKDFVRWVRHRCLRFIPVRNAAPLTQMKPAQTAPRQLTVLPVTLQEPTPVATDSKPDVPAGNANEVTPENKVDTSAVSAIVFCADSDNVKGISSVLSQSLPPQAVIVACDTTSHHPTLLNSEYSTIVRFESGDWHSEAQAYRALVSTIQTPFVLCTNSTHQLHPDIIRTCVAELVSAPHAVLMHAANEAAPVGIDRLSEFLENDKPFLVKTDSLLSMQNGQPYIPVPNNTSTVLYPTPHSQQSL